MVQEKSGFAEIPDQQKLTKEDKEELGITLCQYKVLFFAIGRLHHYADIALNVFAPFYFSKETLVKMLKEHTKETLEMGKVNAELLSKQEALLDKLSSGNKNLKKISEEIISLKKKFKEKTQKNLRQVMEMYFAGLSVVGLINEQEEIMKFFLLLDNLYKPLGIEKFSGYFYDMNKINKIKINNESKGRDISFIGFDKLLSSIHGKYNIKNERSSFYDDIKECQYFSNFAKHASQESYKILLRHSKLPILPDGVVDKNHQELSLKLDDFYRYIRAFENFWIHICKNVHKPMECNEFITETHEQIDLIVQKYQELPWHKEGKIMDSVGG